MSKYKELRKKLLRDYKIALSETLAEAPIGRNEFKDIAKNVIPIVYPNRTIVLAAALNISRSALSKWIKGNAVPSAPARKTVALELLEEIKRQLKPS